MAPHRTNLGPFPLQIRGPSAYDLIALLIEVAYVSLVRVLGFESFYASAILSWIQFSRAYFDERTFPTL